MFRIEQFCPAMDISIKVRRSFFYTKISACTFNEQIALIHRKARVNTCTVDCPKAY